MSFLKKLFGSSEEHTCLVIHDQYLECIQIKKEGDVFKVLGANRVELESGIVDDGKIVKISQFQEALTRLFMETAPSGRLFVGIPSGQLYSFLKVFPSRTKEEYCQSGLAEVVQAESPFPADELFLDYNHSPHNGQIVYGAMGSLKVWRRTVEELCQSLGFETVIFVPASLAQFQIVPKEAPASLALLSGDGDTVTLSLFFKGILYDNFTLDASDNLITECKKAFDDFYHHFAQSPQALYLADAPVDLQQSLEKTFPDLSISAIEPKETWIPDDSSITLAGMIIDSFKEEHD